MRTYTLYLVVGNAAGDAWGQLPPSGVMRLFEQAAVEAASNEGYDGEYHRRHGTAWVIRRLTLLMHAPAHIGERLELTTWLSHTARVRAYREYSLKNQSEPTKPLVATGIAEWIYVDREKIVPKAIPPDIEEGFEIPGAPLGNYDPPIVESAGVPAQSSAERVAEWYECDSMGHINNAVYADWLDSGLRAAMDEMGWPVDRLRKAGLQLRGEYFALNYRRAAFPEDRIAITTHIGGSNGRLCSVYQSVRSADGVELLEATSVYGWADESGQPTKAPERREAL